MCSAPFVILSSELERNSGPGEVGSPSKCGSELNRCGLTLLLIGTINVLNAIKNVSEVCSIYCATANPTQIILAETDMGRSILGVVDGFKSKSIENEEDIGERKKFLRKIGYKL